MPTASLPASAPLLSSSPPSLTAENLHLQDSKQDNENGDFVRQRRKYSAQLHAHTKMQWEDCRNDITRRSTGSSTSLSSSPASSGKCTLHEHLETALVLNAAGADDIAGDVGVVPAIH